MLILVQVFGLQTEQLCCTKYMAVSAICFSLAGLDKGQACFLSSFSSRVQESQQKFNSLWFQSMFHENCLSLIACTYYVYMVVIEWDASSFLKGLPLAQFMAGLFRNGLGERAGDKENDLVYGIYLFWSLLTQKLWLLKFDPLSFCWPTWKMTVPISYYWESGVWKLGVNGALLSFFTY